MPAGAAMSHPPDRYLRDDGDSPEILHTDEDAIGDDDE